MAIMQVQIFEMPLHFGNLNTTYNSSLLHNNPVVRNPLRCTPHRSKGILNSASPTFNAHISTIKCTNAEATTVLFPPISSPQQIVLYNLGYRNITKNCHAFFSATYIAAVIGLPSMVMGVLYQKPPKVIQKGW